VRFLLVALGVLVACFPWIARAQGIIHDTPAAFTLNASHFDTSPSANITGVSTTLTQDHFFEDGWWYRIQGDGAEKFFPVPDAQAYNDSDATLTWNNVDNRDFSASLVLRIANFGNRGILYEHLTITNNTQADMVINIFHCLDVDVAGSAGGDSIGAALIDDNIRVTDGGQYCEHRAWGADAYLVLPFGDPDDVPGVLSDGAVTNFNNAGLPFGPGDVTVGRQWTQKTIAPGESELFAVWTGVNNGAFTRFRRGDCNVDGVENIGDAIYLLAYMFPPLVPFVTPSCLDACNANDDTAIDIADAIALLTALFGNPAIPLPPPFSDCDTDPSVGATVADGFDCFSYIIPCP